MAGWKKAVLIICLTGLGLGFRLNAVYRQPVDWDEPVYLGTARSYAQFIQNHRWREVLNYSQVNEHPALGKFLIGLSLIGNSSFEIDELNSIELENWHLPDVPKIRARSLNAFWGALTVGLVAVVNPLAGFLLAIHTFAIKYTSLIYIEAFPAFTSTISGLSFIQYNSLLKKSNKLMPKGKRKRAIWLVISSVFLGLTAASKYIYCVVGVVVVGYSLLQAIFVDKAGLKRVKSIILWGIISVIVFLVFNFYLWPNVCVRFYESISYHLHYAGGEYVSSFEYPAWQPLIWLSKSIPGHPFQVASTAPGVFLIAADPLISGFAIIGLIPLIKRHSFIAYWLIGTILFLLLWPTKWPQYVVIALVPLVISSAEGIKSTFYFLTNLIAKKGATVSKDG